MGMISLHARPEELELPFEATALLLIDFQHAFTSSGGLLDLAGSRMETAEEVVHNVQDVLSAARSRGMQVVHLRLAHDPDHSTMGGQLSPYRQKAIAARLMKEQPELAGELITEGSWDAEIVQALRPQKEEIVVRKPRFSGFAGTDLDARLDSHGVRYLLTAGLSANVCVESTIRDAFFREYWPILMEDGTAAQGPPEILNATLYNIENFFGWVTTTTNVLRALDATDGAKQSH